MKRNQIRNANRIKTLTEEVDENTEEQQCNKTKLKELERKFREEMDTKIKELQDSIKNINKIQEE